MRRFVSMRASCVPMRALNAHNKAYITLRLLTSAPYTFLSGPQRIYAAWTWHLLRAVVFNTG